MSFSKWQKKKKQQEQTVAPSAPASEQKIETATQRPSFAEWQAKRNETSSAQGWLKSVSGFLGDVQNRYKSWNNSADDYNSVYARSQELLLAADGWRKQYAGDQDAVNVINQAVDSLGRAQDYAKGYYDYYSQWATSDEFNAWNRHQELVSGVLSSEDLEQYVTAGEAKGVLPQNRGEWYNQVAYLRNNPDELARYEKNAKEFGGVFGSSLTSNLMEDQLDYKAAKYMTKDEYAVYNYFVGKGEMEKAEEFLSSIEQNLDLERGKKIVSEVQGKRLKEIKFAFESGTNQFWHGLANAGSYAFGLDDVYTNESLQYANAEIGGSVKGMHKVAYDLTSTVANMLPSILVSFASPNAGVAAMGISASGNAYTEMKKLGYDNLTAQNYAFLVGTSEAVLQKILGGISSLGGASDGIFQKAASKILTKVDHALARVAIQLGGNMLDEGLEESIQSVLEPIFKMITTGDSFEGIDVEEVVYSGLLGMLSAGLLEGAPTVVGSAFNGVHAKGYYGEVQTELLDEALALNPGNKYVQRLKAKVDGGKKLSGAELNRLVEMNEHRIKDAETDTTTEDTEEMPPSPSEASTPQTETASPTESAPTAEKVTEGKFGASETGKTTHNGNEVKIRGIASIDNGEVMVQLDNGDVVNARDVEFSTDEEALIYEATANMDTDTANDFIQGFNDLKNAPLATPQSAYDYMLGFNEAITYGELGIPYEAMARDGKYANALIGNQAKIAYNRGKTNSIYKAKASEASRNSSKATQSKTPRKYKGETHVSEVKKSRAYKSLSDTQKAGIAGMTAVYKALGIDVYFFESPTDSKGNRTGKNGYFNPSDNSVHIDLYAGLDGRGLILFTGGHELTHYIRANLPTKFKAFAEILFEQYEANGTSVSSLIAKKRDSLEKKCRITPDMTSEEAYDLAYEEVVADACEAMLGNGEAFAQISEKVKAKDDGLWNAIKKFFTDLVAKIKAAYAELSPDSVEGQKVAEMLETATDLQQMWVEMLVEASEASDLAMVDASTESVAPMFSERTWTASEYVTHRDAMAKKIAKALGVSTKKAKSYIDDINSIAKMIADDRTRLDYEASSFGSAFVSNVEYGGSFDYTTLCKKRRIYTGTFTEIQKRLHDVALSPDDILKIRNLMIEEGIEATCGLCYVEGSRANMGKFAKEFIRLYKRDNPMAWIPNMADVNTPDGVEKMRISHPEAYDQYVYFWNHYGKLKDSDPALFASQQKPKLYEARKEYKGEILEHFKGDTAVAKKNLNGGIRMQSFSDFEIVHLIDTMQVIMDMSTVGLAGQAYTKVPEFAKAFGNTGLKINLSLIAKGVDADGNLIYDDREGMPHETAFALRNQYSANVGTIIVTFTDEQLLAAMADPRIDFIIPFHRSQWKKGQYGAMGLPKGTKDYTYMQNEKLIKKTYHEYRGRMVLDKASNYMPNEYWDFSKSGKENAEAYLKMCAENNKRPKFYKFLDYDGKGTYSLKADGSTDGYWKLLIDFKMYDNNGVGSPQQAVTPTFNMDEAKAMLDEYKGGHSKYPVASSVVDTFVNEYNKANGTKYSDRDTEAMEFSDADIKYSIREEAPPKKTMEGYKVFVVKNGKLYPPMVANPNAEDTPVGVWLNADVGTRAPDSKTGRMQVKAGGKGTQGGSGSLAFRPGWHLGETPLATQFDRLNPETGVKELFPENFVWALCDIAADHDYQEEAMSYGYTKNGKFQHSLAGLPKLSTDGYYKYRTNPNPDTVPWLITGAMKVKKLLSDAEVNAILAEKGLPPKQRVGGDKTLADLGLSKYDGKLYSDRDSYSEGLSEEEKANAAKVISGLKIYAQASKYGVRPSATYTEERMDREIRLSSSDTILDYAKSYITWVSPVDFIYATTTSEAVRDILREEAGDLDVERLQKQTQPIHLTVNFETGEITGHEGRHRMLALQKAGIYRVAVVIDALNDDRHNTKPIEFMILTGQNFGRFSSGIGFYVHNMLPLSKRYAEEAKKLFSVEAKNGVRYSDRDSYAPTFYSHMGKVIDDIKLAKMGAGGVVPYLKGKGVKNEEIKWSGIEAFLEGKKSVTKAELQEFVAGSQLQIEETTLDDRELPMSQERSNRIAELEAERIEIAEHLKSEWKRIVGTDIPISNFGAGLESVVSTKLVETDAKMKGETDAGRRYAEVQKALKECIEDNDDFGYDNTRQAYAAAVRNPEDFLSSYELSASEEQIFRDLIEAKRDYQEAVGIPVQDRRALLAIAEKSDKVSRKISDVKSEHYADEGKFHTKWKQYRIDGGSNYRELVFKMPNSSYSNNAMAVHWGDEAEGILAHARIQDITTKDGKNVLFVEEIQSDWHNAGAKEGYSPSKSPTYEVRLEKHPWDGREIARLYRDGEPTYHFYYAEEIYDDTVDDYRQKTESEYLEKLIALDVKENMDSVPDAPFRTNYHEYVLKRLLRMAAEEGYDSLGWTPSDIQTDRWSDEYAEGYRIEYDQEIPKFLRKYGKKWGATVGTARTTEGYDVWSMDIPNSMKDSVLHEGQVLYSDRNFPDNAEDIAKNHFGTTTNWSETGWLLTDGTQLDFSGRHWENDPDSEIDLGESYYRGKRNVEHYEIAEAFTELRDFSHMEYRGEHLDGFLSRGNIRIVRKGCIDLQVMPTDEQFKKLRGFFNESVDAHIIIGIGLDGLEFSKGTKASTIIEGIRDYFSKNRGQQSDLMRFHTMYSDRDPEAVSNRSLLANALESVAQNDIERKKLKEYKGKIALIESEQAKLAETKAKIKELSFTKGRRDTEAIKKLQFEANQSVNRINIYDRQLLNLEATTALKGVLQREKQLAYKKAEKEGKEALAKYREKAAKTQRELLTRYQESRQKGVEGRRKTEMRRKIKKVVNELNQYLLKGTKEKHVPIELQKAVAEALDAVNMDTVSAEERIAKKREEMLKAKTPEAIEKLAKEIESIREMGGNLDAKLARLKTAYDSIINSDDPLIANSHDDVISSSIDKVVEVIGDTPLRDMSLYQLEAVYDLYKMVLHSIRAANKAFKAEKGESIAIIANGVIAELDGMKQKSPYRTKASQAVSEFDWNNQKPVYAFERIGSKNFTKVFEAVRAGEDVWATDMNEAQAFREEQFKKYKYDSWDFKKRYRFTSTSGKSFELTLDQILSLYAFSKRAQAGDHLKYGGFVFDGLSEVKVKNKVGMSVTYQLKDATAYNLSDETLLEIIGKLTPEQKEFADAMQDYLSTVMGEKGNEVSLELYDIKLFKEKNYFPLRSAPQYLAKAKEQAQGEVKIKNSGFTKETSPKAKNPIVLSSFMDVWAGHVNEMSMYHAFTLPLEDFYRVYNYHTPADENMSEMSVSSSLENAHGQAAVKYIDQLLKDLNGGARSDPRETLGKSLMANFKKASVMASLSVVVQQPTAIVRAMAVVNGKYLLGKPLKQKHKDAWAEVKKYAPVAVIKEMGYFDTGMGQGSVEWLKGEKTFMDKVDDATSKLPALADEVTWVAIWNAVKRETVHTHKHLAPNSDAFLKVVGERFTEVITKTQVYDSTLSRSAHMRSKSVFMQMVTSFMAEPTTSINMLQDAFKKGNKKHIARTMAAVYGSVILNSALVSIVYAMRDDDEDETFLEKYLSRFTTEVIDGVNPLTYIPFVKDIWSAAQGFDIERADMSLITDLFDSFQQMVRVINKDTSDMDEDELAKHRKEIAEAILSITDSFSSMAGIPVKNVRRDINGAINAFKTIGTDLDSRQTTAGSLGDNILEDVQDSTPIWGWFPGKSRGEKLLDAILEGDTTYVDRFKSGYKDEDAYHTAVSEAIRERHKDGRFSSSEAEQLLIEHANKTEEEAFVKVQAWDFKNEYPKYKDLSESAINKFRSDAEPAGISLDVYYDYCKRKAKCEGIDEDGDGRADSGTKKAEVMEVIDSLPISDEQKDALYFLNGWSESTLWQAPWH